MITPPFKFDSFETLTKKEAQTLFDWYISCIPERVALLEECFNDVWRCCVKFDYNLSSLDPLWECYEKHIEIERKSEKQIRAENKGFPEHVINELLKDNRDLSKGTYIIALDIAMYYGETLARNLPGIHWGFFDKPKSALSVNKAVLLGFENKQYLDPTIIVLNCTRRSMDNLNPKELSQVTDVWRKYLP